MVADSYDDCEGDLLAKVRAIVGPNVAIGAEFDLPSSQRPDARQRRCADIG